MNVARLNIQNGDHESHQEVIDLVKEYSAQSKDNVIFIMLDTKGPEVISGDVAHPILLPEGQEFNFTFKRGVSSADTVGVNYDDFVNDVEVDVILLVDGGMMLLSVISKTADTVKCKVIDGGELKSRRHLNVRGKGATLPSITSYMLIYTSSPIISASDRAMVACGDLGAELSIEVVPLLQVEITRKCRSMRKPVIVATNMLASMINHPTPTRAKVSDIAIAEGAMPSCCRVKLHMERS